MDTLRAEFETFSEADKLDTLTSILMHRNRSHVGMGVKLARLEKGMTQTELAEKSGVPQSEISRLESEESNITLDTFAKIGAVLHLELFVNKTKFF